MADTASLDRAVPGAVYRTLLQFALLGTELGEIGCADDIASVLGELRPDLPQARIVRAMNAFCSDRMADGIHELESTLEQFPDSQLAKAMLAVCLHVSGRSGWQPLLEAVIDDGRDEYAIGLACAILGRKNEPIESFGAQPGFAAPANAMWA